VFEHVGPYIVTLISSVVVYLQYIFQFVKE
jgi:hypothetical protein